MRCAVCVCVRDGDCRFSGNPSGEVIYSFYLPSSVTSAVFTVNMCQPETTFDTYIWCVFRGIVLLRLCVRRQQGWGGSEVTSLGRECVLLDALT